MASEKLSIILELVTGNYKREAKDAADATGKIGGSARSVTDSLGTLIGPAAIGGAVIGLGKMALAAGENADRLFDLQAQTGASTDQLQEYEFVAKAAGAGTEFFSDAVKAVIKNLDATTGATGMAAGAYEQLGINVFDATGKLRAGGDITEEAIQKLAGMENVTARNALAQDIFGKKWEETVSVLDMGTEAIAKLTEEAHEMGAVISNEALIGADKFREAFEKLKTTVTAGTAEGIGEISLAISALFGDEQSQNAMHYAEAVRRGNAALEDGVPAAEAYQIARARLNETEIITAEQEQQLADLYGVQNEALERQNVTLGDHRVQMQSSADAVADAALDQWELGDATSATTDEIKAQRDEVRAAIDPLFALQKAAEDSHDAQIAYSEAVREFGPASDEARDAARDLIVAQADLNYYAELYSANFGPAQEEAFRKVATQAGLTNDEINAIIDSTDALNGKQVDIFITTHKAVDLEALEDSLAGGRAAGGPVSAGRRYLVGEKGPELFIPGQSGMILPNQMMGAKSGNVTNNKYGPTFNMLSTGHPVLDAQLQTITATVLTMVEVQN